MATRLWRPFHYEVPKGLLLKGENVLEIKVTNSLTNEFGKQDLPSGLSDEIKLITNLFYSLLLLRATYKPVILHKLWLTIHPYITYFEFKIHQKKS